MDRHPLVYSYPCRGMASSSSLGFLESVLVLGPTSPNAPVPMSAYGRKQSLKLLPLNDWYWRKQTFRSPDFRIVHPNGWYARNSSPS